MRCRRVGHRYQDQDERQLDGHRGIPRQQGEPQEAERESGGVAFPDSVQTSEEVGKAEDPDDGGQGKEEPGREQEDRERLGEG